MRRRALTFSTITVLLIGASASLLADRVRLRSGQTVEGSFMSADVKIVRILLASGEIAEFPVADITAVEFRRARRRHRRHRILRERHHRSPYRPAQY
jgi:hypothetical protein